MSHLSRSHDDICQPRLRDRAVLLRDRRRSQRARVDDEPATFLKDDLARSATRAEDVDESRHVGERPGPFGEALDVTTTGEPRTTRARGCPPHLETLYRASIAVEAGSYYEHALRNVFNGIAHSAFVLKQRVDKRAALRTEVHVVRAFAAIEAKLKEAGALFAMAPRIRSEGSTVEIFDASDVVKPLLDWIDVPGTKSLEQVVPLQILARKLEFELAVFCLLENAADAISSNHGGRIEVRLRRFQKGGAVEVHDDGPGLIADEFETAFSPFFTRKANHLGLGLPIARLLARRLGGNVDLAPSDFGGLCARLAIFEDQR